MQRSYIYLRGNYDIKNREFFISPNYRKFFKSLFNAMIYKCFSNSNGREEKKVLEVYFVTQNCHHYSNLLMMQLTTFTTNLRRRKTCLYKLPTIDTNCISHDQYFVKHYLTILVEMCDCEIGHQRDRGTKFIVFFQMNKLVLKSGLKNY